MNPLLLQSLCGSCDYFLPPFLEDEDFFAVFFAAFFVAFFID